MWSRELVPQDRPAQWTTVKLVAVRHAKRRVMAVGGLFYDNLHFVNSDPANPLNGQPRRFSPVTKSFVCRKANTACDLDTESEWTPLEGVPAVMERAGARLCGGS